MLGSPIREVTHSNICFAGLPGSMHDYGGDERDSCVPSISCSSSSSSLTSCATTPTSTSTLTTTIISEHDGCDFSGFEGPEKKLEVIFRRPMPLSSSSACQSLRLVTQQQWQSMLDEAQCKIISITSNPHLDCYLLSESSLIVYPHKIVLKTCGTTTPLYCIPKLLAIAAETCSLLVDRVFFSRKNYVFPHKQLSPHTSFIEETTFLDQFFEGSWYILGSLKKDHWYLYMADRCSEENNNDNNDDNDNDNDNTTCKEHDDDLESEYNLEIMMHDLDSRVMKQFFKRDDFISSGHVTENCGISDLLPNSAIDAFMFDPCGYSMNGLLENSYSTIHITPEKECSFVSYETNVSASYLRKNMSMETGHEELIRRVLHTFRPGRATVTLRCLHHSPDTTTTATAMPPLSFGEEFTCPSAKLYQFDGGVSLAFFQLVVASPITTNTTNEAAV